MKKSIFESLKFFCAAILCLCLSAFTSPSRAALPSGYTELEYIESTGTQYIDTGVTPNENYTYNITFIRTTPGWIMGNVSSAGNSSDFGISASAIRFGTKYVADKDFSSKTTITVNKSWYNINGTQTNWSSTAGMVISSSFYLFWAQNSAAEKGGIIYSMSISDAVGSLVRNFVPAKNSSGKIGMYDTVNNRFYTNAGTGEFIAGDPVVAANGACYDYTSATGTGVQNGTPTPDNPIEPTFYKQGNMVLRKVGDYADTYDATTGKITRRVGVKVLYGTEIWNGLDEVGGAHRVSVVLADGAEVSGRTNVPITHFKFSSSENAEGIGFYAAYQKLYIYPQASITTLTQFKQWVADQYAAGTPVMLYYPLAEETTEDWTESQYCNIKIATTKYNETKFSPLNTALQNAISVVDTVVTQTISQAASIATLQAQKQTRPADDPTDANNAENCPAGKKCLLVTDTSGIPHWYEIVENAWDLPAGYTQLEYIESTGTQYIDTGISGFNTGNWEIYAKWLLPVATQTYTYANVFSVYSSENHNSYRILTQQTNSGAYYVSGNSKAGGGSVLLTNKAINQIHTATVRNGSVIFDGETIDTPKQGTTLPSDKNMGIFARGDASGKIIARIYSVNVKKDGVLIGDFVPVKNSSGVVGMYDTVSGQFFTNQGTGEFVAGPVAE